MLIVYKTTNLLNSKIYVGKNTTDDEQYLGSGKIFLSALKKYGEENFRKEILQICETIEELNLAEIRWIEELDARNPEIGYNILPGGQGNVKGWYMSLPPEERSRRAKKACETQGPEKLSERAYLGAATLGHTGCSERSSKAQITLGVTGRSEKAKKLIEILGPSGCSARATKANETLGVEGIQEKLQRMNDALGEEGRIARSKTALESLGPEGRSQRAKKAWETKRKNREAGTIYKRKKRS